jgi:regulatory subunit for Cdc7p protein kinase
MAAVFIPPSPHSIGMMASRRAPLSNLPNATNSPYRTAVPKRSRPQTIDDDVFDQRPAAKKQIIQVEQDNPRTPSPRKRLTNQITKRVSETKKTPVNGKELAQKERNPAARAVRQEQKQENSLENLRQWRRHYKNVMPTFVFYFESVPLDVRKQLLRQISSFGAVCSL